MLNGIFFFFQRFNSYRIEGFLKSLIENLCFYRKARTTVLLIALILKAPLLAVVIPIFFLVSSLGVIATTSFSLAMETQGHIAGSASALLGLLPFVLGSLAAPLVGIAGEHTAVPMGVVIFSASFLALVSYYGLVRKASLAVQASR
jgi:DHA1 family bicyclomycin/chloramphenicol resistance-like MFS transporter